MNRGSTTWGYGEGGAEALELPNDGEVAAELQGESRLRAAAMDGVYMGFGPAGRTAGELAARAEQRSGRERRLREREEGPQGWAPAGDLTAHQQRNSASERHGSTASQQRNTATEMSTPWEGPSELERARDAERTQGMGAPWLELEQGRHATTMAES
jgi:hypothetical protein